MWKQSRTFNQALGGTTRLRCLRNVRRGYSIPPKYASATQAWNHTQQHRDRNVPTGVDVPLYYYYKVMGVNLGHINVRLANGKVWSDGQIFSSLASYEAQKAPTFLGWGESVNDVRVISYTYNPTPPTPSKMPAVGSKVQLIPAQKRSTFRAGTTTVAGVLNVTNNLYVYTVRGYDAKYPYRILINSASAGGNGVALALYFTNGTKIDGWVKL